MTGPMPEGPQNGQPHQDGQGEAAPWRQQYPDPAQGQGSAQSQDFSQNQDFSQSQDFAQNQGGSPQSSASWPSGPSSPAPQYPGAQGAAGASGAGAPYGGSGPGGPGQPGGPGGFGGAGGPGDPNQPPRKSRTGLIIGLVIAAVAFLLVIVLVVVIVVVVGLGKRDDGGGGGAAKTASPEEQVSALGKEYMDSLVDGDPQPALEVIKAQDHSNQETLEEDAYAKALKEAPVADVTIGEPQMSSLSGKVTVDYTVGGKPASGEISMQDYDDDGTYEVVTGLESYMDVPEGFSGLGLTVNDAEVKPGTEYSALPGSYTVGMDEKLFGLDGEATLVYGLGDDYPDWPKAKLTDDGQKAFREAVKKSVDKCVEQNTLKAGCGLQKIQGTSSDGWKAKDKTVKRSLPGSTERKLEKLTAEPGYDEVTYVTAKDSIGGVDTTMECSKGGQKGTCDLLYGGSLGRPSVDLADDKRPVTWD